MFLCPGHPTSNVIFNRLPVLMDISLIFQLESVLKDSNQKERCRRLFHLSRLLTLFVRMDPIVLLCKNVAQAGRRFLDGVVVLIQMVFVVLMECIAVLLDTFAFIVQGV